TPPAPIAEHLKRLVLLRSVLACVLAATMGVAELGFGVPLRWLAMGALLLLLLAASLFGWLRSQRAHITEAELFLQLMLDVTTLSGLLYLSGGSTNPFVSLYLLPLVIAATTLPPLYAWSMAAVTASCYGLLFFYHLPLAVMHAGHTQGEFRIHVIGMWVNFVLSAGLIAFFVGRMARAIRARDAQLARQKEIALRNERIVALGTLAAGAAHELGTPLSTMAVILNELAQDHADEPELSRDLATLRQQVGACKQTITHMVAAAGEARAEGGGAQAVDE